MERIFVDTDVCLDLLSGRKPFSLFAERLFTLSDLNLLEICVSSLSFSNIAYVLQSTYRQGNSRKPLAAFKQIVTTLSVDSRIIDLALTSDIADFEDAIQYYTATENQIGILVTRNVKDYKNAQIQVVTPETYLS
ncbi:PIN domain-containing protein [Dyadobacter beijingensis]|uniref:PIN domain-containing protein n=1 Tax=Dyadobacter beijingensis TaxID=365489 RepID=A0ABQ2HFR5_9BACT|nr:PIN domain-containing protein [Dyadobacter beijingensis]GGM78479.1 PIN domain-containing protein [Dyadobacter beijingensis]